jgi:hypothetical protein
VKPAQSAKNKTAKPSSKQTPAASPRRKLLVFACLLGGLTLTSALLRALAPAPLSPNAVSSLFAIGAPESLEVLFKTNVPIEPGRWRYIYVRHSQTLSGSAVTLGEMSGGLPDHFVIGNGDGCVDGELQLAQRWTDQSAAGVPPGLDRISPDCISI